MTVVVTDCEYRAAVSMVQALGQAGHRLILTHSSDMNIRPPAFCSRYAAQCHEIDAQVMSEQYICALEKICRQQEEKPVLLPAGAKTLYLIAANRERFEGFCKFLIADEKTLDHANNKAALQKTAQLVGVPTPKTYEGEPERYPVIVKPLCGEKLGLKAAQRYARADNAAQFREVYTKMQRYDPKPLVQDYIEGDGVGVSVLMDEKGNPASIFCHRRIREYPVTGGPSTCCVSFYDQALADYAITLLRALSFRGIAMVEFKGTPQSGYYLLEINPRIWGSYPETNAAGSNFTCNWADAAAGKIFDQPDTKYRQGVKMRYPLSDLAATLGYLKAGKLKKAWGGIKDAVSPRVRDGLYCKTDKAPARQYRKNALRKAL